MAQLLYLVSIIIMVWYAGAVYLNSSFLIDRYEKNNIDWSFSELASDSWSMERPVLPSPHQIANELKKTIWDKKITSPRSLVYHSGVTLSSAMVGFLMGTFLGIVLSVGIVYVAALDRTLMPWIIASQTIPILALAPMIVVVLGSMGIIGLVPKAMISTYLCFFPVVVGMVKGLRSPSIILVDLMNSYSASKAEVFWKLRLPASIPYLFASLKVAIALKRCWGNCSRASCRCSRRPWCAPIIWLILWPNESYLGCFDNCFSDFCNPSYHSWKNGARS